MASDDEEIQEFKDAGLNEPCPTCGGTEYENMAGFYYCTECGLQSQVREVHDWDRTDVYVDPSKAAVGRKIGAAKVDEETTEKLTIWEEYNIYLHGLVQQFLSLGANSEFQLVTLQLWTEYLRRTEAAFFDKNETKLPKLGAQYRQSDAEILYNKRKPQRLKKRRSSQTSVSVLSESTLGKKRRLRKEQENLVRSEYISSQKSEADDKSSGQSIRLKFSRHARRNMKKVMPKSHIKKHEISDEHLSCHTKAMYCNTDLILRTAKLSKDRLISIIALALNLTNDPIQNFDITRFMQEKRIYVGSDINKFFPANHIFDIQQWWSPQEKSLIRLDSCVRELCAFLKIKTIQPNILPLCERFIDELCLPKVLFKWIERLYLSYPYPTNCRNTTYRSEIEAMSYIIYFLKLTFGLDGYTEQVLSKSASEINENIGEGSLFIFTEWMNYIEMRKCIMMQWKEKWQTNKDKYGDMEMFEEDLARPSARIDKEFKLRAPLRNILHECYKLISNNDETNIEFENSIPPATLKPNSDYFKILLKNKNSTTIFIPDYMNVDHTSRNIDYLIHPNKLINHVRKSCKINLIPYEVNHCADNVTVDPFNSYIYKNPNDFLLGKYEFAQERKNQYLLYKYSITNKTKKYEPKIPRQHLSEQPIIYLAKSDNQSDDEEIENCNEIFEENEIKNLNLALPHFHIWGIIDTRTFSITRKWSNIVFDHSPASFTWLIKSCADLIGAEAYEIMSSLNRLEGIMKPFMDKVNDEETLRNTENESD